MFHDLESMVILDYEKWPFEACVQEMGELEAFNALFGMSEKKKWMSTQPPKKVGILCCRNTKSIQKDVSELRPRMNGLPTTQSTNFQWQ